MHVIYVGSDAFFELDSDRLKPAAAEASLRELLEVFDARPELRFVLTGHADTTGTPEHNLDLSRRRAQAIANWVIARGVVPSRVEIVGAGSSTPLIRPAAPVAQGGELAGVAQALLPDALINQINRRVEITIACPPPGGGR
jgi:outer membrane protein OmpA-like peptidoglycan-associated protein